MSAANNVLSGVACKACPVQEAGSEDEQSAACPDSHRSEACAAFTYSCMHGQGLWQAIYIWNPANLEATARQTSC